MFFFHNFFKFQFSNSKCFRFAQIVTYFLLPTSIIKYIRNQNVSLIFVCSNNRLTIGAVTLNLTRIGKFCSICSRHHKTLKRRLLQFFVQFFDKTADPLTLSYHKDLSSFQHFPTFSILDLQDLDFHNQIQAIVMPSCFFFQ